MVESAVPLTPLTQVAFDSTFQDALNSHPFPVETSEESSQVRVPILTFHRLSETRHVCYYASSSDSSTVLNYYSAAALSTQATTAISTPIPELLEPIGVH